MTKSEAARLIAALKAAYPRGPFPPESAALYAESILDLPVDVTGTAIRQVIRTADFMPTIAEVRRAVAELVCNLPSPETAWAEVERALRRYSPDDSSTWTYPNEYSHPLIGEALTAMGGLPRLETTSTFSTDRREYARLYEAMRTQAVRSEQIALGSGRRRQIAGDAAPTIDEDHRISDRAAGVG